MYGSRVYWEFEGENLIIKPTPIKEHAYKGKVVPSGFFDLELANNVSAVIFSNAGTLAKFDRMGVAAGCLPANHMYWRMGFQHNPDPNATSGIPFTANVGDEDYQEWWTQEVQVFHNPNAKFRFPFNWLLGATHHYFENGMLKSYAPQDAILSSVTSIIRIGGKDAMK